MAARPKPTKRTEFGNIWDESDPAGMLEQWGNRWIAWIWWVIVLEEAEVWLGEREVHHKGRDGEEVMPALLAVRAMLLGYAVECALKALWLRKKGNDLIRNGKYVGVKGAGDHNLVQLAQQAGFIPTVVEARVLRRLTKFAVFAGRYPVARTAEEMRPDGLTRTDVGFFSKREFRFAESILNKIRGQVSGKKRNVFPRRLMQLPRAWRAVVRRHFLGEERL
jgi:hypothetical protein